MMAKGEIVLPQSVRDRAEAMIAEKGASMTARLLGISFHTLKVARLGGAVTAGTLALLEKKIAERDAAGKVP